MSAIQLTATELKTLLDAGEVQLIDCREPAEHAIAHIAGSELIPMNTIPAQIQAIEKMADAGDLVVYCHHGMRSLSVVNWLRQQGVENVQSLDGGIDAWSAQVDSSVPRY